MRLHEYQSKPYLARYGIRTLQGKTAETQQAAFAIAAEFDAPVVVNAQTLADQRVFRLAQTPEEARSAAGDILAMSLDGIPVRTLLIEPAAQIAAEFLLGLYANRGSSLLMVASIEGGTPIRETINPFLGVLEFQARNLANGINLPREHWSIFTQIAQNLQRCAVGCDAVRAEIHPLALTESGTLIALGGRLEIDDNALFRQPELAAIRDLKAEHESAVLARAAGISYVRLSGRIGCVVSGAGLGMATMDLLARHSGGAANFLDLGSDIRRDKIVAALRLILPDAQAVLFNIFADKARCDEVARELLAAFEDIPPSVPLVIRLAGQNADEGQALLQAANLPQLSTAISMSEAVRLAGGSGNVNSG